VIREDRKHWTDGLTDGRTGCNTIIVLACLLTYLLT